MLVLSRRPGQKIVIGNEVTLEVISVSGEEVRLGVTAPGSTSIHRFEVFAEIQNANSAASLKVNEAETSVLENLSAHVKTLQST